MIWICFFTSLIAANAGAIIITKTHITTTKIDVSAQLDTHSSKLTSLDSEIVKVISHPFRWIYTWDRRRHKAGLEQHNRKQHTFSQRVLN
jgi:hypothetical protein